MTSDNPKITYHEANSFDDVLKAADLIDENGHRTLPVDRFSFLRLPLLVIAKHGSRVVGAAAVSRLSSGALEIGFMTVHRDYRRQGIARKLTEMRILFARRNRCFAIYAMVRPDNKASWGNLKKIGFRRYGYYLHKEDGTTPMICCYYPLTNNPYPCELALRNALSDHVPIIRPDVLPRPNAGSAFSDTLSLTG